MNNIKVTLDFNEKDKTLYSRTFVVTLIDGAPDGRVIEEISFQVIRVIGEYYDYADSNPAD